MQIFVLGMHRSGTSLVTRILMRLGCWAGPESEHLDAKPENPRGFWERNDVRRINDAFLHAFGADWHLISGFHLQSTEPAEQDRYREQARLIVDQLNERRPWVVKEPRLCLLFPLWRPLLDQPAAVLSVRHPVEVAHSLLQRNGFPLAASVALWEAYVVDSLNHTAGIPRLIVQHGDFFHRPQLAVTRITQWLQEHDVATAAPVQDQDLADLIDPVLHRQRHAHQPVGQLLNPSQRRLYECLCADRLDDLPQPLAVSEEAQRILAVFDAYARLASEDSGGSPVIETLRRKLLSTDAEARVAKAAQAAIKQQHAQTSLENERLKKAIDRLDECRGRLRSQHCRAMLAETARHTELRRTNLLRYGHQLRVQVQIKCEWIDDLQGQFVGAMSSLGWRLCELVFTKSIRLLRRRWDDTIVQAAIDEAEYVFRDFQTWRTKTELLQPVTDRLLQDSEESDLLQSPATRHSRLLTVLAEEEQRLQHLEQVDQSLDAWLHTLLNSLEGIYRSPSYRIGKQLIDQGLKRVIRRPPYLAQLPYRTQAIRHRLEGVTQAHVPAESEVVPTIFQQRQNPLLIQYTPASPRNPYYSMISDALSLRGWQVSYDDQPASVEGRIAAAGGQGTLIHFHQLEPYYHCVGVEAAETRARASQLADQLHRYKQLGARLVWTAHNPLPHDRQFHKIDRQFIESVLPVVDAVVVLGRNAKAAFERNWKHPRVMVVQHPSFQFTYGDPVSQVAARERLGLAPDEFILGHFGHIKPYKGLELMIKAFAAARTRCRRRIRLLIAGSESPPGYGQTLREIAGDDVTIRNQYIADEELPCWLGALDASLFAFRDIWASSSVILSLSHGVPVIAPRLGCLPEYVQHGDNGYLYDHGNVESLVHAIVAITDSEELAAHHSYMCDRFNREFGLDRILPQLEQVYRQVQEGGGSDHV